MISQDQGCPCLSGDTYFACCGRFHREAAQPPTAEWLMRSRYSAFVCGDVPYLLNTWHPRTKPRFLDLAAAISWRRLDIVRTERGGMLDREGVVEFVAHYREDGVWGQQHEVSRFLKVERRWYYLDAAPDSTGAR